jgi:hypothetical protein
MINFLIGLIESLTFTGCYLKEVCHSAACKELIATVTVYICIAVLLICEITFSVGKFHTKLGPLALVSLFSN